ncbi:electron transport complex subunit RsxC [Aestuariibacter halophilus]|uniref:Ion-translocating oxidoreductase complex subunit C n=1 Tax=Fluctibacter halophilus TaxID=226011 RepID=A0ABS8GAQ3_9ALTE|nr:electron transport complex subunit RsxC [Aestuariibacter halophilus]MCC2616794.1 electron transport complex subunit RsxC [Aestuariibacter halophilus]
MYVEFDTILERLNQGRLWDFPGGVHPDGRKTLSNKHPITHLPMASELYVTVKQHIGTDGQVCVNVGDRVLKGQPLTRSTNPFAVPVHAPTSGHIKAIGPHVAAHPSGLSKQTVTLTPDGEDEWIELKPLKDYQKQAKTRIIEAICAAGISGMGGAGFPTHIKVAPKHNVEFLIINGVECEPYITADDCLMREHAWQIRQGIDVLMHLLSPKKVVIAIEDNKPEAIEAMQVACDKTSDILVVPVPTKYPAGGEKQLIQVITGREVPRQGLPIDVGVITQNVGTCYAVADAIMHGKPLIERVVTLTGEALNRPRNAWVPIGTPMSHLLAQGEYHAKRQQTPNVIMGGPMMGFTVTSNDVPVVKTTNCMLVGADHEIDLTQHEEPCIRCSACADACPASLLPQQLFWHSKAQEYDKAQDYNLFDCIECGACAFECPSHIPLVHYYRKAKADIRHQQAEKDKADKARERFEARKERLAREQAEREEKHRKAAEARRQAMNQSGDDAKDKIAAALARAKAKKAQETGAGSSTASTDAPSSNDKVAAAIARAKAKRAQAAGSPSADETPSASEDNKQDKVAAAIARAKAKRAAQKTEAAQESTPDVKAETPDAGSDANDKQARIAAAVAKAKAKRAAQQTEAAQESTPDVKAETPDAGSDANDKQARIAAAVAKAKAKRAAQHSEAAQGSTPDVKAETPDTGSDANDKQARIAAAVAKAKARRAAKADDKDQ